MINCCRNGVFQAVSYPVRIDRRILLKEFVMKNFFKLFGVIALAAVIGFSMAACDTGGGGGGGGNTGGGTVTLPSSGTKGGYTNWYSIF
jgi:hypothetical protein